jgi:hypothetical protein
LGLTVTLRSLYRKPAFSQLILGNFSPDGLGSTSPSSTAGVISVYTLGTPSSKANAEAASSGRPSALMGVGQKRPWKAMLCTHSATLVARCSPRGWWTVLMMTGTSAECQSLATITQSSPGPKGSALSAATAAWQNTAKRVWLSA